ncbi:MAG: YebC/PmpR family DNA-binding transcriptional regulator [Bacteroidota bacterium]|nr:YebC/PmpR family DNA-binding transcriptional regulator [Bacteroidota bacterium]MDP4206352.1 YebC/PmpR family DNA-binding transcriptional regulator [Bacteroidota bacterium]
MGRAFEYRKERKFARWNKMAKTFTRLGKEIVIAVKAGGPHPETNPRLRALVQNAKAANMPKDNVERAIKRAVSKDQADYKEVVLEGYAPYGIALLIEAATDNNTRTVGNVRSYFNKFNGSLGTQGSVEFMFEHKCFFKIKNEELDQEELELELIDYGADEIYADEDGLMIWAPFNNYGVLQSALEEKGFEVLSSGFDRIPQDVKELTPEQQVDVEKLLERLDEDDDVQNVYHNMA